MTTNCNHDSYFNDVVQRGDEASGSFKCACDKGNESSMAHYLNILNPDGSININVAPDHTYVKKLKAIKETIDGVGTKVQIYTNQFENVFQMREGKKIDGEEASTQSIELWERMLMDLLAMNSDDLRGGDLAIAATNIIDINHLKGARGHLFQDTMATAMKNVIGDTRIAMVAGETAVLGQSPEAVKIYKEAIKTLDKINNVLIKNTQSDKNTEMNKIVGDLIDAFYDTIEIQSQQISFNIGGTCTGLSTYEEKLVELRDGQLIIGLQEKPVNGIIGPRSNGITKIRDDMYKIMGDGWENMTFEDFLQKIGSEKEDKIPLDVKKVCGGKKLWDISTGRTTVFNPFVAGTLLGGVEKNPIASISSIIHVTGNPLKKISEGINKGQEKSYNIDIDMSKMPTPHIITLLQVALDISDGEAMNKWNMGVPYALVVEPEHASLVIRKASEENINAEIIANIREMDSSSKNTIRGVGLNKGEIVF